ncbi:hypothetical protein LWC34_00595 [Kibdelosporangium philippinense]|uniref:Uncharacterized protein n=1 Tax=Kibdelosporangium philippinense TaxID=211113 RepID=A0ABS8Z3U6_9PSEU|nr:hypothetical protein [Kibdelosporangium philippinense]MCE7001346.1 hypothetical protein [Kibdelosporangium philippinense]
MGKFEEQLLSDLMREHGPELAEARRPVRRSTKPAWVTTGVAVAAAAAVAFVLVPGEKPAHAVTKNDDGTVTVSVNKDISVDVANQELKDMELPMRIDPEFKIECIQGSGEKTIQPGESALKSIKELARENVPTRITVRMDADGQVTLIGAECDMYMVRGK